MLFVSEEDAVAAGMTHEGVLYGIRVWYRDEENGSDDFYALPFFILGIVWLYLVDTFMELACYLTKSNVTIEPEMVRKLSKQGLT